MLEPKSTHGNLATLDVLRGIAIISVLVAHFWPGDFPGPWSLIQLCAQFGVILFFFLSGFLMDRTYASEPQLFPYFVRRSFRILPMYWLSILVVFVTQPGWTLRDAVSNAIFATSPMNVVRMSGVYWTLYIEVLFYAMVPLVFFAGRRAIVLSSYLVIGLFGTLWLLHVRSSVAPYYLVYCFLGLQFGAWQRKVISSSELSASGITVVVASSILPIVAPFPPIVSPFQGVAPLVCVALLYLALRVSFRARVIEFFGDASYSLYLLHAVVGWQVITAILAYGYPTWIAAGIGMGLSLALSTITYVVVERPAISAGKQIIGQWRARQLYDRPQTR